MQWREMCGKRWKLWNSSFSPGDFLWMFFQLQMKECLWCKTKLGNLPIKWVYWLPHLQKFSFDRECFLSFSMSEINVVANPSCVFCCQTPKKTIKGSTLRSNCSNSQWINLCVWASGQWFIRKCQGRRDACGRQLNDPHYMRLRTHTNEKITNVRNE